MMAPESKHGTDRFVPAGATAKRYPPVAVRAESG